jgi:hypothetical protein
MSTGIYLAKWNDGSFSFFFGESQKTMLHALDKIGDPSDAEVRIVPPSLMRNVTFDQKEPGLFEIDADVEHMLWRECKKQVWPLEALGS